MKLKKILIVATLILTFVTGCNEEELDLQDPNVIVPNTFFRTSGELQSAVNGTYSFLQTQGMYGRIGFFLFDNLSQENLGTDALQGGLKAFMDYTFDPSLGELFTYWQAAYRGISSANFVIESAEQGIISENIPQDEVNQRLGEVRFLRAFYYFNLTNLWGSVPLAISTNSASGGIPKASQADIYALILDDLTFAVANLAEKGNTPNGRATKGAALALKGKVHLFLKQWAEAKSTLQLITGYSIVGVALRDNGNEAGEFNSESLFEVNFDKQIGGDQWDATGNGVRETTFRGIEYAPTNFANIIVRPSLFNQYEADDPRIKAYFYRNGDKYNNGQNTFTGLANVVWRKYQNLDVQPQDGFDYSGINFRVMRYADVLLMLAEAENELGNLGAAIAFLNQVRDRVQMPNYGTSQMDSRGYPVRSKTQVFEAIVHERAVELAGEQIRFFDLKRWGLLDDLIIGFQTGKHELLPIPQAEIDANPDLTNADQNPGY
jgi:hypothetical protein